MLSLLILLALLISALYFVVDFGGGADLVEFDTRTKCEKLGGIYSVADQTCRHVVN